MNMCIHQRSKRAMPPGQEALPTKIQGVSACVCVCLIAPRGILLHQGTQTKRRYTDQEKVHDKAAIQRLRFKMLVSRIQEL